MDFKRKGPDVVEVEGKDGRRFLFSYGEPVAVYFPQDAAALATVWRTERYVSRTTERHITDFVKTATMGPALRVPHEKILNLIEEA